ncbi:MAG: 30S ribosome-binding factor RbfA [Desulfobacteraceae bacterium]|nr:30S ribosome-binding factor RbfA [Desulfobacteraceae bacterium]
MKPYPRADRIGVKIQAAISELLIKKVQDPRIEMAIISKVEMSSDLSVADVYFSVFGKDKDVAEAKKGFKSSKKFIKKLVAPKLNLKYMPDLNFKHDKSFAYGSKIDAILHDISKKKKSKEE